MKIKKESYKNKFSLSHNFDAGIPTTLKKQPSIFLTLKFQSSPV